MSIFTASAKINLSLSITGKTNNGYHLLDSLISHTEYGDTIKIDLNNTNTFTMNIVGEFAQGLNIFDNSVLDGARMIHTLLPDMPCAHITLTKNLPIASGIGGGSSDCATVIKGLLSVWHKPAPTDIHKHLLTLGADVPVCYERIPCIMQGIGEIITPHDIPKAHIVLCNPKISVSTPDIFKVYSQSLQKNGFTNPTYYNAFTTTKDLVQFLKNVGNDLYQPAVKVQPIISKVLSTLQQSPALYTGMSGSGATCFALCPDKDTADFIAKKCIDQGYWAVATKTL